jgi:hypothetical protein
MLKCVIKFILVQDVFPAFQTPVKYPALTPDGKYLIFLSGDGTTVTAYETHRNSDAWTPPAPLDYINRLITQTGHEVGGFSFNHDGTTLYFHTKIDSDYFDIFSARKTRQGWSTPQRAGKPVSADADLFSPTISSDNKTLFVLRAKPVNKKEEACKELLLFEKSLELQAARKTLALNITDSEGVSILPVDIEIVNLKRDESGVASVGYNESGHPVLSLRTNDSYELNVTKKGFTYFNAGLNFETARPETLDIIMDWRTMR